jgi:hypothetical protein
MYRKKVLYMALLLLAGSMSFAAHVLFHPPKADVEQQARPADNDGSAEPKSVNMPSYDGGMMSYTVDGEMLFYDSGGEAGNTALRMNTMVCFTPKNTNKRIEIEFVENDLAGDARVKLYSGKKVLDEDSESDDPAYSLPAGSELTVNAKNATQRFASTDATGALSVGYEAINSTSKGWKAIVREVDKATTGDANEVRISTTPQVVTVDKDISFYDDGGPTGKCTKDFKGSITFVPSTPGKKVMLEFLQFDIFNTSTVGYNDIFKVYNGKTADEAQLQGSYLSTPSVLKSWADDGALTISFEVKTGIPRDGWRIVVKEFTPEPMTVEKTDCSQETPFAAPAGTANLNALKLCVTTKNTKDPLILQSARFTTTGSDAPSEDIAAADLWYSGLVNDFSKAVKVGNGATNPNGEFTLSASQPLKEGNNYFWLTYNLGGKATSGHKVDATCEELTISGKPVVPATTAPSGNHTVANIYRMKEGTYTQKIFGEWGFTDDNLGTGGKYAGSTKAQVVTFVPLTPGRIIELDIDKFDLYYSSSSYGAKAQFEVYSGESVKASELLWKLDKADAAKVGPGKMLRSKAANGTVTVVFNANESASYYTSAGWEARVKEYQPTDMTVASLTADQPVVDNVKPGATDAPLLRICAETVGNLNPISLGAINLNLKGCESAISKAKLYYTGSSPEFSTTTLWSSAATPAGAVKMEGTQALAEGKNYFWLAVDVADNAKNSTELDASCTSLQYDGKTVDATSGDPNGSRRVVNEVLLAPSINATQTIDDYLTFYDDGGKDKNHSNSFDGTVTFVPADPTKSVKIEFSAFSLEKADKFEVYGGKEVSADKLISTLYGDTPPRTIVSTSDDGALTIHFKSDRSVNKAGWQALVSTAIPQPLKISSIVASHPTTSAVVRGCKDVQLLKVAVTTEGDKGQIPLDQLQLALKGSSVIERARVYYTGNNDYFAATQPLGAAVEVTHESVELPISQQLLRAGTYYYWILVDTKAAATPNTEIDASLAGVTDGKNSHAITEGDPKGSRTITAGAKGTFVIGTSAAANFKTFAEAVTSIQSGIEGNVTFVVEPGIYNEIVTIPHIDGASENARITFKSQTGEAGDVTIKVDSYSEPEYGKDPYGVFNIAGADYISIENMSISTTDSKFEAVVYVTNISRHVTLRGDKISTKMTTTYSEDIGLIKTKANNIEGQNNDYITIDGNTLTGGYIGINVGGAGYVSLTKEVGAAIRNNKLLDQGSKSIYVTDENDLVVEANSIKNYSTTKSGFQGMDLYRVAGRSKVGKNTIYIAQAPGAKGIECRPVQNDSGTETLLTNNFISIVGVNGQESGILLSTECRGLGVYHNSVLVSGQSTNSRSFSIEGKDVAKVKVANNLFQNTAGGLAIYINRDGYQTGTTFERNGYFSSASTLAKIGTAAVATYAEWSRKATDTQSIDKKAEFYSAEDLHLKSSEGFNIAAPLDAVKDDFDGDKRDATAPFVGADEYNAPDLTAPVILEGYPKVKEVSHEKVKIVVNANESGKCYYQLLDAGAEMPNGAQLKEKGAAAALTAKQDLEITLDKLSENKEYTVAIALEDVFGNICEVIKVSFKTTFRPTEESTFEKQEENSTDPTDGTAKFTGFKVIKGDGARKSAIFARCEGKTPVTIALTNTDKGLTINGFFLRSASPVTYRGIKDDGSKTEAKTVTSEAWTYVCLFDQGDLTSVEFDATTAPFDIDNFSGKPEVLFYNGKYEYSALQNEKFTLKADFGGGALPISVKWKELKTQKEYAGDALDIIPQSTGKYLITAKDAFGQESFAEITLKVEGVAEMATFEDLNLATESRWWGYDSPSESGDYFYSGSYKFNNFLSKEISTWGGFGYSNYMATDFSGNFMLEQFRSAAGHGVKGSKTYGVVYTMGFKNQVEVTNKPDGDIITGTFITNSAWVASVIKNGDSMAGDPFKTGDWYKVTATGYDASGTKTSTTDFYLADYRSADPKEHKLHTDWAWWDLTSLGKVKKISFTVDGSRSNSYGLTIPAYFCIDNFNGPDKAPYVATPIEKQQPKAKEQKLTFDLSKVFADDDAPEGNTMLYEVLTNSNTELANAAIDNQMLTINLTPRKKGTAVFAVKATSEGKSVEHSFTIERNDEAPYVANPITNQNVYRKSQTLSFDLSKVFADDDAPEDNTMMYEVAANSDESVCTASIADGKLKVAIGTKDEGKSTITLRAISEGVAVEHTFTVSKEKTTKQLPELTWVESSSIVYGKALSTELLNATANVPGNFTYTPEAGTILPVGTHEIKALFTPNDAESYEADTKTIELTVTKAPLSISKPSVVTNKLFDGNVTATITSLGKLSGVVNSDLDNVSVTAVASYNDATAGNGKTIRVVYLLTGSAAGSYVAPADYIVTNASISEPIGISKALLVSHAGCEGSALGLSYTIDSGTPSEYQVVFGDKALAAGFKNAGYTALPTNESSTVYTPIPAKINDGTYQALFQLRDEHGVTSDLIPFSFTINISADVIVPKFGNVVLIDNHDSRFTAYQWYKNGRIVDGATKQFYKDPNGLNGTYHVQMRTATGETLNTCSKTLSIQKAEQVGVSVYPNPVKAGQSCILKVTGVDTEELQGATLVVYSAQGVPVFTSRKVEENTALTLLGNDGTYIGRITTTRGTSLSFKIILVN